MQTTTISLDSALLKQARGYAKGAGLSWNDFAEQALRTYLGQVDPDGAVDPASLTEAERTHFVVVPDEVVAAEGDAAYGWQR
ncbi:hypothetical protein [Knoellia subterranea]|uniref:Uncharacterized protein n=1 Tax=Knoellia subterranea KCTC 19937 TaxID=1385521 RepID=A0A0A0JQL8_9MICO|nr:hypothetical protein [Knoellia subterranea]KGN38337.1 hypothetical protein N803_10610 [Knoellia subterranea KCTC 19937]